MYHLYTDGACSPNPGRGGYGIVIIDPDNKIKKYWGGEQDTTNNRMELKAVVRGLSKLPSSSKVKIHTDSMYVVKCFKFEWSRKANKDLWNKLEREIRNFSKISIRWVRGHSGDKYNEMADELARKGRS